MQLKQYIKILKKRIWIVILFTAVFGIATLIVNYFVLAHVYQADTSLYVGKQNNDNQNLLAYNDIMLNSQLVKDYREFAKSRLVTGKVKSELKLKNISLNDLAKKIGVNLKNDTRLIQITVTDVNPRMARDIANKVADVFKEKVVELMEVENVQLIDIAQIPTSPAKPNKMLNIAIALFLGVSSGVGLVLLIEYYDNTVKSAEDIKKFFNGPIIGNIPVFQEFTIN